MTEKILKLIAGNRNPCTGKDIQTLEFFFNISLPDDYKIILRTSNGGSIYGFSTPLIIYPTIEVIQLFKEHDLYEGVPESLIFGGDGGGTIYGFDLRQGKNMQVFFIREEETWGSKEFVYDKFFFTEKTLLDTIQRIINNEKIN